MILLSPVAYCSPISKEAANCIVGSFERTSKEAANCVVDSFEKTSKDAAN